MAHLSRRRLTPWVRPYRRIAGADRLNPALHDGLESHPHRGRVDRLVGWFKKNRGNRPAPAAIRRGRFYGAPSTLCQDTAWQVMRTTADQ
jgi:hypothetical protein